MITLSQREQLLLGLLLALGVLTIVRDILIAVEFIKTQEEIGGLPTTEESHERDIE